MTMHDTEQPIARQILMLLAELRVMLAEAGLIPIDTPAAPAPGMTTGTSRSLSEPDIPGTG